MAAKENLALFDGVFPVTTAMFADLPETHKSACREYCIESMDDEEFAEHMENYTFIYADIPLERVKTRIMESDDIKSEGLTWDGLTEFNKADVDHGDSRWPSILSGFSDECFQDGWHRFFSYVRKNYSTVPVIAWIHK